MRSARNCASLCNRRFMKRNLRRQLYQRYGALSRQAKFFLLALVAGVVILAVASTLLHEAEHTVSDGGFVLNATRLVSVYEDAIQSGEHDLLPSECPGEMVLDIRDGFVLERGIVGEVCSGILFNVSGGCCWDDTERYMEYLHQEGKSNRTVATEDRSEEVVYILEHSHSETYYHFLIEALPRLEHLWTTISTDNGIKIFQTSSFAPGAFELLGLGKDRSCGDRHTVFPRVLLPPPMKNPRDKRTNSRLRSMVHRLVTAARMKDVGAAVTPTFVVINRRDAKTRRILNHEQLMAGLRDAFPDVNFREFTGAGPVPDPIRLETELGSDTNLTRAEEQRNKGVEPSGLEHSIRAFRNCWGVVAPHGAGLSNLVFIARRNASIVELVGRNQRGTVYRALAQDFGHQHMYVTEPHVVWKREHMIVDVPAVLEAVSPMLMNISNAPL